MSGIYIHIPFCKQQCSYCDFHFSTTFDTYRQEMIDVICKELVVRKNEDRIATIYFGGGTPSILFASELELILTTIRTNYTVEQEVEITLECNPDDCSEQRFDEWRKLGINRLSIGIQSFDETQLKWMNRAHSSIQSREAVKLAHEKGFRNITIDLIYGLPNLTSEEWFNQLREVLQFPIQHISAYCLTVEEKTPLAKWVKDKKIIPADNETQGEQFELLVQTLAKAGFEQYEISNFCRNENYSKHNSAYWLGNKFIGVGPSAHGFDGESRYWNVASNQVYIREMKKTQLPQTIEKLSLFDQFNELILLGLRTKWGVNKTHCI
jgi:oxygen-independent coproporphyrinogen III oxidase